MKRYNINVVEHRIDKVKNKSYAENEFSVLQPSTYVCGQKDGRTVSLEIKGYVLEEAECEDDDEMQYAWEFIACKFASYPGPTYDEHEEE